MRIQIPLYTPYLQRNSSMTHLFGSHIHHGNNPLTWIIYPLISTSYNFINKTQFSIMH